MNQEPDFLAHLRNRRGLSREKAAALLEQMVRSYQPETRRPIQILQPNLDEDSSLMQ